ncbi:hypothetical protein JHW43_001445, partial [Diplocarpon mali]
SQSQRCPPPGRESRPERAANSAGDGEDDGAATEKRRGEGRGGASVRSSGGHLIAPPITESRRVNVRVYTSIYIYIYTYIDIDIDMDTAPTYSKSPNHPTHAAGCTAARLHGSTAPRLHGPTAPSPSFPTSKCDAKDPLRDPFRAPSVPGLAWPLPNGVVEASLGACTVDRRPERRRYGVEGGTGSQPTARRTHRSDTGRIATSSPSPSPSLPLPVDLPFLSSLQPPPPTEATVDPNMQNPTTERTGHESVLHCRCADEEMNTEEASPPLPSPLSQRLVPGVVRSPPCPRRAAVRTRLGCARGARSRLNMGEWMQMMGMFGAPDARHREPTDFDFGFWILDSDLDLDLDSDLDSDLDLQLDLDLDLDFAVHRKSSTAQHAEKRDPTLPVGMGTQGTATVPPPLQGRGEVLRSSRSAAGTSRCVSREPRAAGQGSGWGVGIGRGMGMGIGIGIGIGLREWDRDGTGFVLGASVRGARGLGYIGLGWVGASGLWLVACGLAVRGDLSGRDGDGGGQRADHEETACGKRDATFVPRDCLADWAGREDPSIPFLSRSIRLPSTMSVFSPPSLGFFHSTADGARGEPRLPPRPRKSAVSSSTSLRPNRAARYNHQHEPKALALALALALNPQPLAPDPTRPHIPRRGLSDPGPDLPTRMPHTRDFAPVAGSEVREENKHFPRFLTARRDVQARLHPEPEIKRDRPTAEEEEQRNQHPEPSQAMPSRAKPSRGRRASVLAESRSRGDRAVDVEVAWASESESDVRYLIYRMNKPGYGIQKGGKRLLSVLEFRRRLAQGAAPKFPPLPPLLV